MSALALLSLATLAAVLGSAQPARPPPPPPPPPTPPPPRPLALLLRPPAAANLIPGGRYAASRPGLSIQDPGCGRDKTGNWPLVFPSSGKAATKTPTTTAKTSTAASTMSTTTTSTAASPAPTAATTKGDSPSPAESTLPLRADAAPSRAANIATVESFSQVFGQSNSVLDGPQVSRCVWAIVTCCSPDSRAVRYGCFEQWGCHGAFWDTSPCDRHIARSAIEAALQFYL